jgi:hypothetical protein
MRAERERVSGFAVHRDQPYVMRFDGITAPISYEPAESTTAKFGVRDRGRRVP